jgi:hypothetical protein
MMSVAAGGLLLGALPASAQTPVCQPTERSLEQILPEVTLSWDSAFLCAGLPESGTYQFTVTVTHEAGSEAVDLLEAPLVRTTPRPFGQGPDATGSATVLPLALQPGESASFTVSGDYTLVTTDEGSRANLHFLLEGQGAVSGVFFRLGINAALRGPAGTVPDDDDDEREGDGPPPWAPGPPPWAGPPDQDDDDGDAAPGGPPPWAGPPGSGGEGNGRGPRGGRP